MGSGRERRLTSSHESDQDGLGHPNFKWWYDLCDFGALPCFRICF